MKPLESLNHGFESTTHVNGSFGGNTCDFTNQKNNGQKVYPFVYDFQINDLPEPVRNLLIKQVTLEEISCYSGTNIKVLGSFVPTERKDNQLGLKPLYLHIQASKKQNIDRAVQRIKVQIQQAMNLPKYKEKVLIGLEAAPAAFDVRGKVLGPGGANLQYITNETGAIVTLRGRGSGFIEPTTGLESIEPLHLCVEHNKYDVLQSGRQLAFNLIETVQQEWYNYNSQQQNQPNNNSAVPQHMTQQPGVSVSSSSNVGSSTLEAGAYSSGASGTVVTLPPNMPPPTNVPPPTPALLTVPPPTHHAVSMPPPPTSHAHTLQLAPNLNQLVQAPPPQIQTNIQPPPTSMQQATQSQPTSQAGVVTQQGGVPQSSGQTQQQTSSVQQASQGQQVLAPTIQPQQQQLLAQQTLQAHQLGLLQPSVQPQLLQTNSVQELPTHVYTTGAGGQMVATPNILTQQVIPQTSIIAQQPQIIAQTSYPLQYMQGGQMVVYGTSGAMRGDNSGGVMLVQYQQPPGTPGIRPAPQPIVRPIIQPQQIVQIVNPQTGQVQHVLGGFNSGNGTGGLLGAGQVLLPQPQLITPHQLQFAQIPQPQPIHILGSSPHQSMVQGSGGNQNVVVSQGNASPHLLAVRPLQQVQPQKRKLEQDSQTFQQIDYPLQSFPGLPATGGVVGNEGRDGSPAVKKERSAGDDSIPQLQANRESPRIQTSIADTTKLVLSSTQQVDLQVDSKAPKRGRPSQSDGSLDVIDSRTEIKDKVVYSYGGGKPFGQMINNQPQQVMCSVLQQPSQTHQQHQVPIQHYNTQQAPAPNQQYQQPYYQQPSMNSSLSGGTIPTGTMAPHGGVPPGTLTTGSVGPAGTLPPNLTSYATTYNSWGIAPTANQQ